VRFFVSFFVQINILLHYKDNGLLTASEEMDMRAAHEEKPPQGGMSLRRTQIGLAMLPQPIAHSPSTTAVRTRRYGSDKPEVLTQ